jgi:hypothetical protein
MFICRLLNFTLKLEFIDKIFWTLQLYIVLNSEGPIYSLCITYSFWVGLKDDIIDASACHLLHSFHQSQSFPFNYGAPSLDPWQICPCDHDTPTRTSFSFCIVEFCVNIALVPTNRWFLPLFSELLLLYVYVAVAFFSISKILIKIDYPKGK